MANAVASRFRAMVFSAIAYPGRHHPGVMTRKTITAPQAVPGSMHRCVLQETIPTG
jgi:hypothetical protein